MNNIRLIGYPTVRNESAITINLLCDDVVFDEEILNKLELNEYLLVEEIFPTDQGVSWEEFMANTSQYICTFVPGLNSVNDVFNSKLAGDIKIYKASKKVGYYHPIYIVDDICDSKFRTSVDIEAYKYNHILYKDSIYRIEFSREIVDDDFIYTITKATKIILKRFKLENDYMILDDECFILTKSFVNITGINEINDLEEEFNPKPQVIEEVIETDINEITDEIKDNEAKVETNVVEETLIDLESIDDLIDEKEFLFNFVPEFDVELIDTTFGAAFLDMKKKDESRYVDLDENQARDEVIDLFYAYLIKNGFLYEKEDVYNFFISIMSSELVILAGKSGIGKSKLPLKFAQWFNMNRDNNQLLFVPISPSYTEPQDVLGFYNPQNKLYCPSETGLVKFLHHASENPDKMHLVIFDEMNLSQVEYWFSTFISILENDLDNRVIDLYDSNCECLNSNNYPSSIKLLNNIRFVGTINVDETTKSISDRLLDRSLIINLKKLSFVDLKQSINENNGYLVYRPKFDSYRLVTTFKDNYIQYFDDYTLKFFDEFDSILSRCNKRFSISFRTLRNISKYLSYASLFNKFDSTLAIDYIVSQTIIKKIKGSMEICKLLDVELPQLFKKYNSLSNFNVTSNLLKLKSEEIRTDGFTE